MYACTHVRGCEWTRCARGHRYVCKPRQMPRRAHRWVHVCQSPSVHLNVCVCGHPTIFRYMKLRSGIETRVWACGLWRVRARVRPRGLHQPQGTIAATYAPVCPSCARGCVRVHAWRLSMASARSSPRLSTVARRARAAHARDARQVDLLHEGKGAPRVARPVQALGVPVRRARRRPAALRVSGGAGAALLRMALPRHALGRTTRRWMRRRRGRSSAAAEAHARRFGARGRPARGRGGPEPPGAAARWRAGGRVTPSSRRCRRRSTGRA
jgi:hypothetical protein